MSKWVLNGKTLGIPVLVFCSVLSSGYLFEKYVAERSYRQEQIFVYNTLGTIRARLEGALNRNLMIVQGLIAIIRNHPDLSQEQYAGYARYLIGEDTQVRNIGTAPGMVLSLMYPAEGNEAAIGLDYREHPEQREAALRALNTGETVIAGPVDLVQGGRGLIARMPVYQPPSGDAPDPPAWGIVSAVIDVDAIYQRAGLKDDSLDLTVAIRGRDALGERGKVFYGDPAMFTDPLAVLLPVSLPSGSWQLAAKPKGGWHDTPALAVWIKVSSILGSILLSVLTFVWLQKEENRKRIERLLKQNQQELDAIIEHLPSMLSVKDANDLRYVRFNHAGEQLLGISREQIIGKSDHDLFAGEQASLRTARDWEALASSGITELSDELIETRNGTRTLHTRKVVIDDDNGNPRYLLCISEDVTGRKQAEADRARMQRELQQAQKMEALGQLTGGIAHDFNNILGVILGYAGLALEYSIRSGEPRIAGYLEKITKAGNRAKDLVAQMLTYSREDAGEEKPLQLKPLIEEDLQMLRATLPSTVEIRLVLENDLPNVAMDPVRLNQLLMNLSINARDAMRASGTLTIGLRGVHLSDSECSACHKRVNGDWLELSVADTGSGIGPEIQKKLFEPFFTTKEVGKGSGLGLSVVHGIVHGYDGHIIVTSTIGTGTQFSLLFPPSDAIAEQPGVAVEGVSDLPSGSGRRILVLDDEQDLAEYLSDLLQLHGYNVETSTDSIAALELIKSNPEAFSLLITDQTMPGMTGVELIRQIRRFRSDFPVIICTGFSERLQHDDVNQPGVRFLQKPVDADGLIRLAADLISSQRKDS